MEQVNLFISRQSSKQVFCVYMKPTVGFDLHVYSSLVNTVLVWEIIIVINLFSLLHKMVCMVGDPNTEKLQVYLS